MRNRIVTAVKQRFSIRKLSIGVASVLLGTSLYFMGGSTTIVHAATNVSGDVPQTGTSKADVQVEPASAGVQQKAPTNDKIDKNDAIDKYAQVKQEEVGDNALIRASGEEPTTPANQGKNDIQDYINYKKAHPNTVSGKDIKDFADQGLSIDDEKDSEINQITVDHNNKDNTLPIGQSKNIDGIDITHTDNMTYKEQNVMKINSKNKVIVDFQHGQCQDKEITVTYDNLKNSYYLENIDNKTNKIKITKIERTFSDIQESGKTIFTSDGIHEKNPTDGVYDECHGPQLIIYNDPYDGFFYNNIEQVSVKDIYYGDNNKAIDFENGDNKAWIFVTSLNSNGGGNVEKVKAENPNGTSADIEKIAGSTVTGPVDENTTKEFTRIVDLFDGSSNGDYLRNYLRKNADNLKKQGWIWQDNSPELTQTVTLKVKKTDAGYVYDNENAFFKGLTLPSISENGTEKYPDIEIPEVRVGTKTAVRIRVSYSANNSPKPLKEPKVDIDKEAADSHDGWWYSDESNSPQNNYPDWDNKSKDNRYAFVGAVAIQYQPGMTITYGADDTEWGSHWACMQTQVVSSLNQHFVNRQDTVTRTIHYLYDNGNTAQPDKTQTVSFNETGTKDDVTGKTTWDNDNAQTVDSVITPSITGYTPDQPSIEKQAFKFGDKDVEVTVHYNANTQTAKITYIDDTTKTNLDSKDASGKFGQAITFATAPADEIASYEKQGYVLVSSTFDNNKYQADNSNNVFYVHLKHDTKKVSQEHSASFTVHYIYKDGKQAKPDHEQTLSFTENGTQDLVTQKITWTPATSQKFDDVTTPVITGYTPDQAKVAGQTANFETGDRKVTVTYLPDVQLGHINYIDDNTNKTLTRDDFSGRTNEHEDYTPIDRIQEFENKGYELVSNDYPDGGFNFDNNDQQEQVFNVHLKHGTTTVTSNNPGKPGEPVDPKNPEGPKYPNGTELDQVKRTGTQTIHYVGAGDKTPADNKQNFVFTREITFDDVTGKIISVTPWNIDSHTFGNVDTPVIPGYHADKAVAGGATVTPDDLDKVITVTYTKNGKIIPVDKNGNPITGADQPVFPTNPTDPTKVDSGNIPDLSDKGYHPLDKNVKPGDPVDPDSEDPSKDITVKYVKSGTISVKYHDNTEDKDIDGYGKNASGDEDDPFSYDPTNDLKKLTDQGYVLDGDMPEIPAKFTDGAQEVIINLKHGTTTVTPDNPGQPGEPVDSKNPEGPKYPNGTELDQVKRTGTQTIHYVGAGDKTPADNKQNFVFTREITFDDVTGKIISVTPWNVQSYTFGNVDTPVIPGYHADKAVAGGATVTPADLNKVITVTYIPDGGSGDNPGSNGGGDQGTTPTPEPTPDDQPDTKLPSDNNTDKDVEKDKQDKPEKVKKARKIIKTRITKQEHIGNAEKAEPLAEQEHNDQTVASPVKNEANEPQLPQTGEANTSVIGLLGMLVAGFAAILGFESSRSRKHKN